MSIDKQSDGVPEVNVHRPTTQVNLWMIAGIVVFFMAMAAVVIYFSHRESSTSGAPKAADGVTSSRP